MNVHYSIRNDTFIIIEPVQNIYRLSIASNGCKILLKFGIHPTIYIVTGSCPSDTDVRTV